MSDVNLAQYADEHQLELYKQLPSTHFLSNPDNVLHMIAWATFWRRNLHRFVIDYLNIPLFEYQAITLSVMSDANLACIIASRNDAKSFIVAIYAVARCLLYPTTMFRIGSATLKQAKLIVTEKILGELCQWSPILNDEIEDYSTNDRDISVEFKNGSRISVFVANENARGMRSHAIIREEFRQIKKNIEDEVISPFQMPRHPRYIQLEYYKHIEILQEEPVDIYISSSWYDNGHWMWETVDRALKYMLEHKGGVMLAFDESIAIKHRLKTLKQLMKEHKKQDPTTWAIEFLNLRVKDSTQCYFTYSMLMNRQILKYVFYPREHMDVKNNVKNKYAIPKLDNEVRVISNDISFVAGSQNDNSVYSCIRAIPETNVYGGNGEDEVTIESGYRRVYPYIESNQMGDTTLQAIRIRQLYEDFGADYIVLDCRNGGVQVLYSLQKPLYDEERGVEYAPLKCMNNDIYAKACQDDNAPECIFAINASQALNSEIAVSFRTNLVENKIDLLASINIAKENILSRDPQYIATQETERQLDFEKPFLETQLMIYECASLQYEKLPNTGAIKVTEQYGKTKDRYTSCSYGSYFIDLLERDSYSEHTTNSFQFAPNCISSINFD